MEIPWVGLGLKNSRGLKLHKSFHKSKSHIGRLLVISFSSSIQFKQLIFNIRFLQFVVISCHIKPQDHLQKPNEFHSTQQHKLKQSVDYQKHGHPKMLQTVILKFPHHTSGWQETLRAVVSKTKLGLVLLTNLKLQSD